MLCGDPNDATARTYFAGAPKGNVSSIGAPDNIAFDNQGNLWNGTDGMESALGCHDAICACVNEGPERATRLRQKVLGPWPNWQLTQRKSILVSDTPAI